MNEEKLITKSRFVELNPERPIITQRHISIEELIEELDAIKIPEEIIECMRNFCKIPNTKRVLSLAGGAAQGIVGNAALIYFLEKIGAIQYFDEIWGTSAGAVVGAGYSAGLSIENILKTIAELRTRKIVEISVMNTIKNEGGIFKTKKIHKILSEMYPVKTFEECRIPFFSLAAEYNGNDEWVRSFHSGNLVDGVVASMSIPDIFESMEIGNKMYVDGGLIENTPCISVYKNHQENNDQRNLQILATDFNAEHFTPDESNIFNKALNLLEVFRHQLVLDQLERTRSQENTKIAVITIHVDIMKAEFGRMGPHVIPAYYDLIEKIENLCQNGNWNLTL